MATHAFCENVAFVPVEAVACVHREECFLTNLQCAQTRGPRRRPDCDEFKPINFISNQSLVNFKLQGLQFKNTTCYRGGRHQNEVQEKAKAGSQGVCLLFSSIVN